MPMAMTRSPTVPYRSLEAVFSYSSNNTDSSSSNSGGRREQCNMIISAGTMKMSNDLACPNQYSRRHDFTKTNGMAPIPKQMQSQSVMITSKPADRSQSVMVGRSTEDFDYLKRQFQAFAHAEPQRNRLDRLEDVSQEGNSSHTNNA